MPAHWSTALMFSSSQWKTRSIPADKSMNQSISDYFSVLEEDISRIVDLRGLEAPEPMVQILQACSELGPDDTFVGRLPHTPHPLLPHLEGRQ